MLYQNQFIHCKLLQTTIQFIILHRITHLYFDIEYYLYSHGQSLGNVNLGIKY